jgi:TRAP-type C4-dicarboxylate transport system permease small subunit
VQNMIKAANNFLDRIDRAIEKCASYLMGLLMVAVLIQIVYRFLIVKLTGKSFPYTEEFSSIVLIWAAYLVVGIGLKDGSHASFDLVVNALPGWGRKIVYVFNRLLILTFAVVVVVKGWELIMMTKYFQTPTLQISVAFLYAAPTIGCLLIGIRALVQALGTWVSTNVSLASDESQIEKRGV